MCWNENISLNTFLFGTATLIFIYYNNTYTQYKTPEFKNYIFYFLIFSYMSMQLVEFFLWKSINTKNKNMNKMFSIIGWIILRIVQPFMALLMIPRKYYKLQYLLFICYVLALIILHIYKYLYNPVEFITTVDKNGHLYWKWVNLYNYEKILFIIYLIIFLTLYLSYPYILLFSGCVLLYSYFIYTNTFSSMWCWILNSIQIYFLFNILFIMPYNEYQKIC